MTVDQVPISKQFGEVARWNLLRVDCVTVLTSIYWFNALNSQNGYTIHPEKIPPCNFSRLCNYLQLILELHCIALTNVGHSLNFIFSLLHPTQILQGSVLSRSNPSLDLIPFHPPPFPISVSKFCCQSLHPYSYCQAHSKLSPSFSFQNGWQP